MSEIIQGSPEWFTARCGRVTASRVADIIARTKSGYAASRANYMAQLICERLTGCVEPTFSNAAMAWGTEKEPEARNAYQFHADVDVTEISFVEHPSFPMCGASPDGLVGTEGLVEIKCPNTATHIETLSSQAVPSRYVTQIQWQLACTDRLFCDFVSYDPRLPADLQLFIKRVERDADAITDLEREVGDFLGELDVKISALRSLGHREAA